jgi:hypothetical protein
LALGALHSADIARSGRIAWLIAPLEQALQVTTITFDLPEELVQRMAMAGEKDWSAIGSCPQAWCKRGGLSQ